MKNRAYCVTAHEYYNDKSHVKVTIIARNKEKAISKFMKNGIGHKLWNVINVEEVLHEEH